MELHEAFVLSSKMESLPKEVLFMIFEKLHPFELVPLSRVKRRWYEIALHPRLHRCIDFRHKHDLSSLVICSYISKFKHSLEQVNLLECYWLKGALLSNALQKCRKLTSLNVLGCDITKKTICSVLKLNNLKRLEWSVSCYDLNFNDVVGSNRNDLLKKVLISFCSELSDAFSGLDSLTVRFPLFHGSSKFSFRWIIKFGVPLICSELGLKKFTLEWVDEVGKYIHFFKISIEGSRFQFQKNDLAKISDRSILDGFNGLPLLDLHEMTCNVIKTLLEKEALSTFLLPYDHSDQKYTSFERLETKPCLVNLDVPLQFLDAASLKSPAFSEHALLRYLNLARIRSIDGHLLQVIASSSPNLEILNLQDCTGCLEPIHGLESLAEFCPKLAQLNLNGVHDHTFLEKPSSVMEIIPKFNNLMSLSLCACGLGTPSKNKSSNNSSKWMGHCGTSSGSSSHDSSFQGAFAVCDDRTQWNKLNAEESFYCLTKSCSGITEFELIKDIPRSSSSSETSSAGDPAFVKTYKKEYYRPNTNGYQARCYLMRHSYSTLMAIANWRNLKRLTLSVPIAQGNFEFLVAVTQNCPRLEFLSLASLARLSHSGNVVLLQKALSHCHQLRDFRLEQSNFCITESFILTLSELKHLERVCIIAREGAMKMYTQSVISLFEKCCKLIYFQVLCDITLKASKALMDCLARRFVASRPGLVVSVVPYCRNQDAVELYPTVVKSVPVVHLKELFLFGSTVATEAN